MHPWSTVSKDTLEPRRLQIVYTHGQHTLAVADLSLRAIKDEPTHVPRASMYTAFCVCMPSQILRKHVRLCHFCLSYAIHAYRGRYSSVHLRMSAQDAIFPSGSTSLPHFVTVITSVVHHASCSGLSNALPREPTFVCFPLLNH